MFSVRKCTWRSNVEFRTNLPNAQISDSYFLCHYHYSPFPQGGTENKDYVALKAPIQAPMD